MADDPTALLERLDAAEQRLAALAAAPMPPSPAASGGDESAWGADQVWGHLAEMLPHWLAEARRIAAEGRAAPLPIGRPESDPGRLAGIERYRHQPVATTLQQLRGGMQELRAFVRGAEPAAWAARASTPRYGEMGLARFLEVFIVGHLEAHAAQIEALAAESA